MSRFSWRTAKQAGHLLFEIFVKILAWRCRRLTRFGLRVELGLRPRFEFRFGLRLEFRLHPSLQVAHRRTRACIATSTWVLRAFAPPVDR